MDPVYTYVYDIICTNRLNHLSAGQSVGRSSFSVVPTRRDGFLSELTGHQMTHKSSKTVLLETVDTYHARMCA